MKRITLLFISLLFLSNSFSQTTISGGNVSGTWTKANSPYKINGTITILNGSTLTIEPGVRIEFAQFKYLNVDGRIVAIGGSKTTDSIWFTKQNPSDTGSWKGVKFIKTANTNDTSIFKYCVFRNGKSLYDTTQAYRSGGITIIGYGKVKIANSTFYRNEAGIGAGVFITTNAYAIIKSCTFKNNAVSRFWWWDGTSYNGTRARGSAIAIEFNSNGIIDSCIFKNNIRGKDYWPNPAVLTNASTVDIEGSTYYKQNAFATITNSTFDGNEGVSLYVYNRAIASITNCNFINSLKNKALNLVYSVYNSYVYSKNCKFMNNQCISIMHAESGNIYSNSDIIANNNNVDAICRADAPSFGPTPYVSLVSCKILNNSYDPVYNYYKGGIVATSIKNCLIANNDVGRLVFGSEVTNTTIINNHSADWLCATNGNYTTYKNNIIWGNKTDSAKGRQIRIYKGYTTTFENNLIQNDTANFWLPSSIASGIPTTYKNNISGNPQFTNPTAGFGIGFNASTADFSVKNTCALFSPAINAGKTDTLYMMLTKTDLGGNPRFYEGRIDIGCYENVSGVPIINIQKQAKNDTLCEKSRNGELVLSAIGKGIVYQWQESSNWGSLWSNISGQTNAKLSLITNLSQNTILYRALLNGTCDKDTSAVAMIITNPTPVVNLGKDTAVCKYSIVSKTVSTTGNYLWHTGNNTNSISQKITKDTSWWLQITNSFGCKQKDTVKIISNPLPIVNLGADKNLDMQQQLMLDAGAGQSKYLWNDGSSLQSKTFLGKDLGPKGKYTLWAEVTNSNGCTSRDSIVITVTDNSSVHSILAQQMLLYPQPALDILNIEVPQSFISENTWITISTIEGKTLLNQKLNNSLNQISIGNLESGIYLITISDITSKQTYTLKLVKS